MMRLLLLSCLAFGLALGDDAGVEIAGTDGKYYLYNVQMNWFDSVYLCSQLGKQLITFNSEADYNRLINLIKKTSSNNREARYWTAASDLGRTGKYVWMSTGAPLTYTRWRDGQPTNYEYLGEVEHCVEIQADYNYKMNDAFCNSVKNIVICEDKN